MKKIGLSLVAFLFCLPAFSKVIALDCIYPGSKNKLPVQLTVRLSMDTESQMASATNDEGGKTGKLFSDGSHYWFTTGTRDISYKYQINRHDLSVDIELNIDSGQIKANTRGQCTIAEVQQPKI